MGEVLGPGEIPTKSTYIYPFSLVWKSLELSRYLPVMSRCDLIHLNDDL